MDYIVVHKRDLGAKVVHKWDFGTKVVHKWDLLKKDNFIYFLKTYTWI